MVYFEIDSKLYSENLIFDFMIPKKHKVKTIKLRGELSQGLVLPLEKFEKEFKKVNIKEDLDIIDILKITKINVLYSLLKILQMILENIF